MSADLFDEQVAIETTGLSKRYGNNCAVDHLDLRVERSLIFGFLGPNGAGKTTTLRLLLGLVAPSEGEALIFGKSVRTEGEDVRALCGALLEHHGLYERLSAEENLLYHGRINRMSDALIRERGRTLLEAVDLWDRRAERVGTWSKGMKQSLAIARAVLHQPRLLLLDEPTSGLDARTAALVRRQLVEMVRKEGVTLFLTTHNLAEAEQVCDSVGIFVRGKLRAQGAPSDLRQRATQPRLTLSVAAGGESHLPHLTELPGIADLEIKGRTAEFGVTGITAGQVVAWLVSRGVEIESVQELLVSLEDVFMETVGDDE